jgi:carbon storage regulator CsrA
VHFVSVKKPGGPSVPVVFLALIGWQEASGTQRIVVEVEGEQRVKERPPAAVQTSRAALISLFARRQEMLALTRKKGQGIYIGEVLVRVSRIDGNRVTLSIDAPREVKVLRGELKPFPGGDDGNDPAPGGGA